MSHPKVATRFITNMLYDLKRRYGGVVTFHREVNNNDYRNGVNDLSILDWSFRKIIVLPRSLEQKFVYDLSYIATNKNFTMGAVFDTSAKRIILDARDKRDYEPALRDYFVVHGKRYDITQIDEFEFGTGYVITGQQTEGSKAREVHSVKPRNRAMFDDSADGEIAEFFTYVLDEEDGVAFSDAAEGEKVTAASATDSVEFNDEAEGGFAFLGTAEDGVEFSDSAERELIGEQSVTQSVEFTGDVVEDLVSGSSVQSNFSIDFDNTDDFIDITNSPTIYAINDVSMSISWWEKVKSGSGTYPSRFRLVGSLDSLGFIRSTDANFATFAKFNHTSGVALKWPTAPSLASSVDIWRHWVITMVKPNSGSSSDSQLYVDGVNYTASTSLGGNFGANNTSRIGYDGGDSPANCLFDDVRIWYNKILTQQEVDDLFANTAVPAFGAGDLYWALEEGSGTNTDEPINGKDGTLTNGTTWSSDVPGPLA